MSLPADLSACTNQQDGVGVGRGSLFGVGANLSYQKSITSLKCQTLTDENVCARYQDLAGLDVQAYYRDYFAVVLFSRPLKVFRLILQANLKIIKGKTSSNKKLSTHKYKWKAKGYSAADSECIMFVSWLYLDFFFFNFKFLSFKIRYRLKKL